MEKPTAVNILLVDDQPGNLLALEATLAELGERIVCASSGLEALKRLLDDDFALILLDVQMPGMDGLETAERIRQRDKTRHTPIIFLTAYEPNEFLWLQGYSLGAVDFLFKPVVPEVLRAKARVFIDLEQKTEQLLRQAEQLRANQRRETEEQLARERQGWEMERLRAEAERERLHAEALGSSREELARLYREIQQTNRRKDEFLAMLAHELRNPLAPIRNALHILRMGGCNGPNGELALQMAERQVGHLARLVDDLLDVSRISRSQVALNKEPTELAAVVARAIESVRPMIDSRNHRLEVQLPSAALWLEADPLRLEQVLVNLLQNAAKYTPAAGRIGLTVETQESGVRSQESGVRSQESGVRSQESGVRNPELTPDSCLLTPDFVVIRVRDTGVGISPELLPAVFDLFVQADRSLDRSQGGLGIGLTLAKNLVELHGGSIGALSEGPGKGSEFIVRLPLVPVRAPVPSALASVPPPNPCRVLVVDDNVDAAESLALLLQSTGHEVHTSHDGVTALESARDWGPEVVLLDIGLPRMDGYEVARRLRADARLKQALVVALTGYGQEEDRRLSREAGFDAHLTKPIDMTELEALMARRANGR